MYRQPLLFFFLVTLVHQSWSQSQGFTPTNLGGPAMKYQGLRDTDASPNAELREKGLKDWKAKRDTILEKARKLLEEKNFVAVNQLLFPFDYLEPEDATFYEYLGKSYFHSGLYQPALDCFLISYELKKKTELLFYLGQSFEKTGNEKEAIKYYKKGAKEGSPECKAKLDQ